MLPGDSTAETEAWQDEGVWLARGRSLRLQGLETSPSEGNRPSSSCAVSCWDHQSSLRLASLPLASPSALPSPSISQTDRTNWRI